MLRTLSTATLPLTKSAMGRSGTLPPAFSTPADVLFPNASQPKAALSGLLLLNGFWDESHNVAQDLNSPEGSYWHGIVHRIEPDSWNAGYWFRKVGSHPIFPALREQAAAILAESSALDWRLAPHWNPQIFIEWCEQARAERGTQKERLALAIQRAEWNLLFNWCAQSKSANA